MTSFKKVISSLIAACAVCGTLTVGAFASAANTNSTTSTTAVNSLRYSFNEVYQEYMAFITDPITRYASSESFDTTVTTFSGPRYSASAAALPYGSEGAYSYSATIRGTGTYSAKYYYYSASSTEGREEVLGIGFDTRETPGSRFQISGTFYPNGM